MKLPTIKTCVKHVSNEPLFISKFNQSGYKSVFKSRNGKLRHQNVDPKQLGAKQTAHFIVFKVILLGKSKIPDLNQCTKLSFLAPLLNVNLPFYMGTDDFV